MAGDTLPGTPQHHLQRPRIERPKRSANAALPAALGTGGNIATATFGSHRWRRGLQIGLAVVVGTWIVLERGVLGSSFAVLSHLRWPWLLLAIELESASIATIARMQRRLLLAGNTRVGLFPMLRTVYAGNAIGVFVPLAGPQMGAIYNFRRLRATGANPVLSGWTVVVSGVASSLAAAIIFSVGAAISGNEAVILTGAATGFMLVIVLGIAAVAISKPRARMAMARMLAWMSRQAAHTFHQHWELDPEVISQYALRFRGLTLPPLGYARVLGFALVNWLADAGVLAVSIAAVGAPVPWRGLLFAYGIGIVAAGIRVTPGGLGIVEGGLIIALVGIGVHHAPALAAVLLYRLVSLWLVGAVGWIVFLSSRRRRSEEEVNSGRPWEVDLHLPSLVSHPPLREGRRGYRELGKKNVA